LLFLFCFNPTQACAQYTTPGHKQDPPHKNQHEKQAHNKTPVGDREYTQNQKTWFHSIQQVPGLHIKIKTKSVNTGTSSTDANSLPSLDYHIFILLYTLS
jgi:hypothetical protein